MILGSFGLIRMYRAYLILAGQTVHQIYRCPLLITEAGRGVAAVVGMKTTRSFQEQVLRKRPYILADWCEGVLRPRASAT